MKKIYFILFMLFIIIFNFFPEIIILKNGEKIKGKIITVEEDNIKIESSLGLILVNKKDIKNIYYDENKINEENIDNKNIIKNENIKILKDYYEIKNNVTGTIKKNPGGWVVDLKYNNNEIKGDFWKRASIELPVNDFRIELEINNKDYKGTIRQKKPLFGQGIYEIDLRLDKQNMKGEITRSYKKTYKKDLFNIDIEDKNFKGYIEFLRNTYNKTIALKLNDIDVSGHLLNTKLNLQDYTLRFDKKKIIGTIERKMPYYNFNFQCSDLTNDELFIFLFLRIYLFIDDYTRQESEYQDPESNIASPDRW